MQSNFLEQQNESQTQRLGSAGLEVLDPTSSQALASVQLREAQGHRAFLAGFHYPSGPFILHDQLTLHTFYFSPSHK